jgi:hypothetical protein
MISMNPIVAAISRRNKHENNFNGEIPKFLQKFNFLLALVS